MEATIKPKGMSKAVLGKVLGPGNRHEVDVRWVEDGYDAGAKGRVDVPGRAFMVLQPKGFTPGAVTPGEQAEPEIPCSVQYLKVTLDGDVVFEADPAARVLIVNGTDLLAGLNDNL
jgi:P2 family phage contractile tail tube protein